jgi:hypothetical protein
MSNTPLFIPVILGTSRQGRQSEYMGTDAIDTVIQVSAAT